LAGDCLCREYGVFQLSEGFLVDEQVVDFLLNKADHEQVLDVIEISFRFLVSAHSGSFSWRGRVSGDNNESRPHRSLGERTPSEFASQSAATRAVVEPNPADV
jgi:transposase InsO family protein